jgi:hypothetical protein
VVVGVGDACVEVIPAVAVEVPVAAAEDAVSVCPARVDGAVVHPLTNVSINKKTKIKMKTGFILK